MYGVVLPEGIDRTAVEFADQLRAMGVETRPFFLGMHRQPALQKRGVVVETDRFPVSDRLAERGLYLPSGVGLTDEQVDQVSDAVLTCLS